MHKIECYEKRTAFTTAGSGKTLSKIHKIEKPTPQTPSCEVRSNIYKSSLPQIYLCCVLLSLHSYPWCPAVFSRPLLNFPSNSGNINSEKEA